MARNVGLTREIVARTALELTAAEGLTKVTLQRVARELGVTPEGIAYYLPRAALHAQISELAVSEVVYPAPTEGEWDARLRHLAYSWQEVMGRYPGVQGFVATYPRFLPAVRQLVDDGVADLIASGLEETLAKLLYGHYHAFLVGWNVVRSAPLKSAKRSGTEDAGRPGAERYAWTRTAELFDFAIESHLEMIRQTWEGKWLPDRLAKPVRNSA
jgi:AcrR family transcriptional regulator